MRCVKPPIDNSTHDTPADASSKPRMCHVHTVHHGGALPRSLQPSLATCVHTLLKSPCQPSCKQMQTRCNGVLRLTPADLLRSPVISSLTRAVHCPVKRLGCVPTPCCRFCNVRASRHPSRARRALKPLQLPRQLIRVRRARTRPWVAWAASAASAAKDRSRLRSQRRRPWPRRRRVRRARLPSIGVTLRHAEAS